jgi:hypothetical protein
MKPAQTSIITLLVIIWGGCTTPVPPKINGRTHEVGIFFERFANVQGNRYGEFTITNALAHPVWFAGYSLQSPAYEIQSVGEEWGGPLSLWWCGTGIDLRELAPNASAKFTVLIERHKSRPKQIRVGVTCWPEKSYRKDLAKVYWSDAVNANR